MNRRPRSDRFGIIVAVLGGLFVALATVLVVLLISRDDGGPTTTAAAGTTVADTTSPTFEHHRDHDHHAGPTSTTTTTTTTAATSSTTTPPLTGDLLDKAAPAQGSPAGRLAGIRSAAHSGYARLVFDFPAGGIPGYRIGYTSQPP